MRFRIIGSALLLATTALGALPAIAQVLPEGNFVHVGEVAGLSAYKVEGQNGLWMISPDNQTVINGDFYDMSGPVPVVNFEPQATAEAAPAPVAVPPPAAAVAPGISPPQAPVDIPGWAAPQVAAPAQAAPPADQLAGVQMIDGIFDQLESTLTGVDADVKSDLLVDLVKRMESASSPAEFQLMLMEWQAKVAGNTEIEAKAREGLASLAGETAAVIGAATQPPAGPIAVETLPPVAPIAVETLPPAAPAPSPVAVETLPQVTVQNLPAVTSQDMGAPQVPAAPGVLDNVQPSGEAAASAERQDDTVKLFTQMRSDGHWFSVGRVGAPTVYAFIDPTCPYCAQAVNALAPEIEAGQLDLRVLLAPVVSTSAPAKIAGILLSEDPAAAFLKHEKDYASFGASSMADRDFSELSAEMNEAIRINREIITENRLPGVPFFAYLTAEGIKFSSGVPEAGKFSQAEPDPLLSK